MKTMGDRLRAARIAAGFRTARDAARHHDWNEDTLLADIIEKHYESL